MKNNRVGINMKYFYRTGNKTVNTAELEMTDLLHVMDIIHNIIKKDISDIYIYPPNKNDSYVEGYYKNQYIETIDLLSVFTAQHITACNTLGIDSSKVLAHIINKEYRRLIAMINLRFSRIITKSIYPKFEDSHKAIFEFKYDSGIVDCIYDNIIVDIQSIKIILGEIQNLIMFTIPIVDTIIEMKDNLNEESIKIYKSIKYNLNNVHCCINDGIGDIINATAFDIIEHADYDYVTGNTAINNIIFSLNSELSKLKSCDIDAYNKKRAYRSLKNKVKGHKNNYNMLSILYNNKIDEYTISDNFYSDIEFRPLNSIIHIMYSLIYSSSHINDSNMKYMNNIIDMYNNSDYTALNNLIIDRNGKFYRYDITIPYAKSISSKYDDIMNDTIFIKMNTVCDILDELNISCETFINSKWYKRIVNKDKLFNVLNSFYDKIIPSELEIFGTYNCIAIRYIKSCEELNELILACILDDGDDEICKEILDLFITSSLYTSSYTKFKTYINLLSSHVIDSQLYTYNANGIDKSFNITEPVSTIRNSFYKNKQNIYDKILKQHEKLLKLYNNK